MKILEKRILAQSKDTRITQLKIEAFEIAQKAQPGQFVVVMAKEIGERIPLTIVDADERAIILIFQETGLSTKLLGSLEPGESVYALAGPLGKPTEIKLYGRVMVVAGGVGAAEVYPVAKALRKAGNKVIACIGARTKDLIILEKQLKSVCDALYVATDDGSYGKKGNVADTLNELLTHNLQPTAYSLIYAVGPIRMMQKVCEITKFFGINTKVSLNALMVDATGMCGCCRVKVGGETKFSCI
ncbi:MAG: sulfide/dihydroorotate dehydrogenase-like FAD/NAD-binding protein, partial [Candidatus Omnitrophota bacterium]